MKDIIPAQEAIDLIRRIGEGDRLAFSRFYDLYSSLAYTFAMRILRSPEESQDLIQEIFTKIWYTAKTFDPKRGKPEAWIIMMTKSRAIDKVRSLRRKDKGAPAVEEMARIRMEEQGHKDAVNAEVKLTVGAALADLPDIHKTVLELTYFEGLTQTEIASRLAIPLGTVKTRIRDGVIRLKKLLKEEKG